MELKIKNSFGMLYTLTDMLIMYLKFICYINVDMISLNKNANKRMYRSKKFAFPLGNFNLNYK